MEPSNYLNSVKFIYNAGAENLGTVISFLPSFLLIQLCETWFSFSKEVVYELAIILILILYLADDRSPKNIFMLTFKVTQWMTIDFPKDYTGGSWQ